MQMYNGFRVYISTPIRVAKQRLGSSIRVGDRVLEITVSKEFRDE